MTAADAVSAISTSADGEKHTVTIAGNITADNLTAIKDAINSNKAKINLDLGGTTGLTEIPNQMFANCRYLISVNIPNNVTSIGEQAFYSCTSLLSVNIPDSVTSIGKEAFSYCFALKSITVPDSVASIGDYMFYDCVSLTTVNYGGTKAQWEELINGVNIYLSENATVKCSDGDI